MISLVVFLVWFFGYYAAVYFYEENHDDIRVTHTDALFTFMFWPYVLYVEVKKMALKITEPQMNATYTVATAKSLAVLSESLAEVSQDDADMLASIDTGKPVMAVNGSVRFVVDGVDTIGLDAATPGFATLNGQPVDIVR